MAGSLTSLSFFRGQLEGSATAGWWCYSINTSTVTFTTVSWGLLLVLGLVMILRTLLCCSSSRSKGAEYETDGVVDHNSRGTKAKGKEAPVPVVLSVSPSRCDVVFTRIALYCIET